MDDLEQECEDVVYEVCDARERYQLLCEKEINRCINLTNQLHLMKLFPKKPVRALDTPSLTNEHSMMLQKNFSEAIELVKTQGHNLQAMIDKIDNLTAVLDQIKRDKLCDLNKLLWH